MAGIPEIRAEIEDDIAGIRQLTQLAFRDRPYAGGDEQDVIDRLRVAGALTLSLVAVIDGELVGQVTFSPASVTGSSQPWFAMGPVSVKPKLQGQKIGAALIEHGLASLDKLGARGCILTGNPVYYQRFGFELSPKNAPDNEPAEFFMLKLLHGQAPAGQFAFHGAFYG